MEQAYAVCFASKPVYQSSLRSFRQGAKKNQLFHCKLLTVHHHSNLAFKLPYGAPSHIIVNEQYEVKDIHPSAQLHYLGCGSGS